MSSSPPFPPFPTELRLKVWAYAVAEPRTIAIDCRKPPFKAGQPRLAETFTSDSRAPALLHVNREARFCALEVYSLEFQKSRVQIPDGFAGGPSYVPTTKPIYVSYSQDTLRIGDTTLPYLAPRELTSIESLDLDVKDPIYFNHFHMDTLKEMTALKTLIIWVDKSSQPGFLPDDRYFMALKTEFEDIRTQNPGSDRPFVKIFDRSNGQMLAEIEGGVLIPGWTPENAHLYEFNE